ncbi:CD1871A family CXXC motif-containing protein [Candidatus Pseudoscillospira sp. SGI.172]
MMRRALSGLCLLGVGVLFLVLGVLRGEPGTVLTKAANVCLECIGLG